MRLLCGMPDVARAERAISGLGVLGDLLLLSHYTWQTVWRWLRRKHRKSTWKQLRYRYCVAAWWPASEERVLIHLEKIGTTRYRYRGSVFPRFGRRAGDR
jgi:hypothetical protein